MKNKLFNEFCNIHTGFLTDLGSLDNINRRKFERKLKSEKQEVNFLSTISEFNFAKFFHSENLSYEYEPKIQNKKTPDFKISLSSSLNSYCDIKRFNISDEDAKCSRLLYELCSKFKIIQKPFYLHVEQLKKALNINIELAFNEIKNWINNSENYVGKKLSYEDEIEVSIHNIDGKSDHALYFYSPFDPKIHPSKIKSDILQKLQWYEESIIKEGFPFFIGIDLRFDTLRDPYDYWLFFLGGSCEDIDTRAESFLLGEYYKDNVLNGLSGLLLMYNQKFYWLRNPRNKFLIGFKNVELKYSLQET